jgi:hypothetical protein
MFLKHVLSECLAGVNGIDVDIHNGRLVFWKVRISFNDIFHIWHDDMLHPFFHRLECAEMATGTGFTSGNSEMKSAFHSVSHAICFLAWQRLCYLSSPDQLEGKQVASGRAREKNCVSTFFILPDRINLLRPFVVERILAAGKDIVSKLISIDDELEVPVSTIYFSIPTAAHLGRDIGPFHRIDETEKGSLTKNRCIVRDMSCRSRCLAA